MAGNPKAPKPKIIFLSLEKQPWLDEMYKSQFDALRAKADVTEITSPAATNDIFSKPEKPSIVIATDAALTNKEFRKQLNLAIDFVRSDGGTFIFAGVFPSFASPPDIKTMFSAFELPWTSGAYHRTEFSINSACVSVKTTYLIPRYSQKALHLANVQPVEAIYLPTASSVTQSMVFAPAPIEDRRQTPAAFGKCGNGMVGYVGDVNAEAETDRVVLSMCGLLE